MFFGCGCCLWGCWLVGVAVCVLDGDLVQEEEEPFDGAAAVLDAHAAVVAHQVSDLGVDAAFERTCGARVSVLEVGEDVSGFGGSVQDAPGLAQAQVGVSELAVVIHGALAGEVPVLLPPGFESESPGDGVIGGVDFGEGFGDAAQGAAGFQARAAGEFAGDVHLQVEDAPLHGGVGSSVGEPTM